MFLATVGIPTICLVLLLLPALPLLGRTINGAKIWVSIGPLNFQPGEFAKIVLAVFFASYLVAKREVGQQGTNARRFLAAEGPASLVFGPRETRRTGSSRSAA